MLRHRCRPKNTGGAAHSIKGLLYKMSTCCQPSLSNTDGALSSHTDTQSPFWRVGVGRRRSTSQNECLCLVWHRKWNPVFWLNPSIPDDRPLKGKAKGYLLCPCETQTDVTKHSVFDTLRLRPGWELEPSTCPRAQGDGSNCFFCLTNNRNPKDLQLAVIRSKFGQFGSWKEWGYRSITIYIRFASFNWWFNQLAISVPINVKASIAVISCDD